MTVNTNLLFSIMFYSLSVLLAVLGDSLERGYVLLLILLIFATLAAFIAGTLYLIEFLCSLKP